MAIKKTDLIELLVEARVNLPDQKALKFKAMYPAWKADMAVEVGQRYQHGDKLYKCKQAHTTADHWKPSIDTAALWEVIDEQHEGTLADPIPYDINMTVYKDKYYIYNGVTYKCLRDSGQPLYAEPASLVGNYFEVV
jgi:hypothetical protein